MTGNATLEGGLLDQVPVGLVITDRKGTVAHWNTSAEELFGWRRTEVLGRKIFALATPYGDIETLHELIAQVSSGERWEGELTLHDKSGTTLLVSLQTSAFRTHRGAVVGVVIVVLDATEADAAHDTSRVEVGARIARARKQAGLTQKALADSLGVTRRSIQGYEAGTVVPYRRLGRLGEILDQSASWFLTGQQAGGTTPNPVADLRAALHEELIAVFAELGASSQQLHRAELAVKRASAGHRAR